MELKEIDRLKKYSTEADLLKIVQEIDDKVIFRSYNREQILYLTMAFLLGETGRRS